MNDYLYRYAHSTHPLRDNATPAGPSPHLPHHYRPWSVVPGTDAVKRIGDVVGCWDGNAERAERVYQVLESRDACRDERDWGAGWGWDGERWTIRQRMEAA